MFDRLAEVAREAERKLGLPPLSKVAESLEKLPDERRLRLIKEVLVLAERVSKTTPELDKVVALIREINSMPIEKLEKLERVLKRIEGIMKKAPEELLSFIKDVKEE